MNILILSDYFPPQLSVGAENIAFEISKSYVRRGHNVGVITINKLLNKGEVVVENYEGIKIYQIGFSYNEKLSAFVCLYNPFVLNIVKKIIKNNNFNVAHIHNIHAYISYSVIGLLAKYNIPSILTVHDAMSIAYGKYNQGVSPNNKSIDAHVDYRLNYLKTWKDNWKRFNPIRNVFIRYQFKKLKKIVCVSKELEKLLNANSINNTTVIHNGLCQIGQPDANSIAEFRNKLGIKNNDKVVLFAGRLSNLKGFSQVQKLMIRLVQKDNNIKLLIVGKRVSVDEKIINNVVNTGWLSKEEMGLAYRISKLSLAPSIYLDPFPTVVLESMQHGTPVIASVYSGAKEAAIDGVTGFHINPFDMDNFADKTFKILDNVDIYRSMSQRSKAEFKERFDIEKCTDKYLRLIA